MSKGSAPRKNRDDKAYANGWDTIFGKKPSTPTPPEPKSENKKDQK